ncbi:MAG TPA: ABC transporter ATP-binding protein [Kineosporiaceae bacterium]|nr:ABC transporter ATP-binding protein [Kineosporiaceae bacterium]
MTAAGVGAAPRTASTALPVTPTVGGAPALATRGLTKRFRGGQLAVDHVDLLVPHGAVFGFLGPNGSGKTTTIRMLLGLIRPTEGEFDLLGRRMPAAAGDVLPRVGALVEGPAFHPYLSGRANLARLDAGDRTVDPRTSRRRIDDALDRVGLTAAARKRYRNYSLGMRQRLGLAAALLRPRDLLVLDEPTNGLDPQGTREVRTLVRELAAEGATVFLSSHLLSEIEQVCSHVGVMSRGRLVTQGTLAELRDVAAPRLRVVVAGPGEVATAAEVLVRLGLPAPDADSTRLTTTIGETPPELVTRELVQAGVGVRELAVERPDLEDVFVSLTGEGFDVSG